MKKEDEVWSFKKMKYNLVHTKLYFFCNFAD